MKKPQVLQLTSIRFFLIAYIAIAHFTRFGTENEATLRFFAQENVVVGAFFVLSGYIMGYVYTDFHSAEVRQVTFKHFMANRLARVYPTYLFVLFLFSPMFIYVDLYYGHGTNTIWHAIAVLTLMQAWFPTLAELWNSPTWFLSALVLAYALFPYILNPIARLSRNGLYILLATTIAASLLTRVIYSNISGWTLMEGMLLPDPVWYFNLVRFNPVFNFLEFLMGMTAARLMMTKRSTPRFNLPGVILLLLLAVMVLRINYTINDMIIRSTLFIPLFLLFITHLHRSGGALTKFLSLPICVYLGNISFSLYIVHSPIGQAFYKRVIRDLFFDEPVSFLVYMVTAMLAAIALYHLVEKPAHKALKKKLNR